MTLAWKVELTETAKHQLSRLDAQVQARILNFLRDRVATSENPRSLAAPLMGGLSGLWKYRVKDYRLVVEFGEAEVRVLVVRIGHRSKIYGGH